MNQFYGIEIEEFSARIAETAMWMMDHIMNNELSLAFGQNYARIPLRKSASIAAGKDALEMDWAEFLPSEKCSYVFGNPPFGGAKYQSDSQRVQVREIARLGGSGGTLDYVAAWFLKAGAYVQPQTCNAQIAFVATNSITQGEQVAQLWPILFSRYGLEISFAHRTFRWGSDAAGPARVHVVIIGLTKRAFEPSPKRLFTYDDIDGDPTESRHSMLSPYLFDASNLRDRHLVVAERSQPLNHDGNLTSGSQPIDNGEYIFTESEKKKFLAEEKAAEKFLRPYIGTEEFLHGEERWILYLRNASPTELATMPLVKQKMSNVRAFRRRSVRKSTLAIADYPERFNVEVVPSSTFLAIPEVSSENRDYIPIGWMSPPTIPSNKIRFLPNANLWEFGIITSAMHMAWTKFVGGRLESRYQYSIGINYNAFPWPECTATQKKKICDLAQSVLDARSKYSDATLAQLYDAETMKPDLLKAHRKLDEAVDSLYKRGGFQGDRERVEHLFALYEKLVQPLTARTGKEKRKKKAT